MVELALTTKHCYRCFCDTSTWDLFEVWKCLVQYSADLIIKQSVQRCCIITRLQCLSIYMGQSVLQNITSPYFDNRHGLSHDISVYHAHKIFDLSIECNLQTPVSNQVTEEALAKVSWLNLIFDILIYRYILCTPLYVLSTCVCVVSITALWWICDDTLCL